MKFGMLLVMGMLWAGVAVGRQHRPPGGSVEDASWSRRHPLFGRMRRPATDLHAPRLLPGSDVPLHPIGQSVWDEENSGSMQNSEAASFPSYLKALFAEQGSEIFAAEPPYEYSKEADVKDNHPITVNEDMLENLQNEDKNEMLKDFESILNEEETSHTFANDDTGRSQFFFQLKDIFKQFHESSKNDINEEQNRRLRTHQHPGVFFNLAELEGQLKDVFTPIPALNEGQEEVKNNFKEIDNSSGGVFFSLVEMLKQYVDDVNTNNHENDIDDVNPLITSVVDNNELMFEAMKRTNITIRGVDNNGGLFFSLPDEEQHEENEISSQ